MDISVIIPTRCRADKLARCVRSLAAQQWPLPTPVDHAAPEPSAHARFEIIVSIDGDDPSSERAAADAWNASSNALCEFHLVRGGRLGINAARNRALERARGKWSLFVNDDVCAQPGLLAEHARAHTEAASHGSTRDAGAVVVGDAPWAVHHADSLFDRLVRESSMVFFYDRMNADRSTDAYWKDWGFRHCYTLNLSTSTAALRAIGGFTSLPVVYGYDDLEAGHRLQAAFGMPVLYRPLAKVTHDHRYSPDEYLAREHTLGRAAWHLAHANPACAVAIFGRDITSRAELEYAREFVRREKPAADRLRASFTELSRTPSDAIAGLAARQLMSMVYEQHLLLKRWEWRRGLLDASVEATAPNQDALTLAPLAQPSEHAGACRVA